VRIGDRIRVQGTQTIRAYAVVGIATFGGAGSLGGAGFTVLTLPEVQALAGEPDKVTDIDVQAEPGVTQIELKRRISARVGQTVVVRTGAEDSQQASQDLSKILGFLTKGLLVFALIALLVSGFVIFNTFTITVAQRTREFGMLRTIGASRRQVLWAVVLEALVIGITGSVLGLLAGIGLAPLLSGLLGLLGFDLPNTGLVIAVRTIAVAIIVGTAVTLVSTLVPALRATRVSPMDAMSDSPAGPSKRKRRGIGALQIGVTGLGLVFMLVGLFGGLQTSPALTVLGTGAVLVFVGVGMLSPLLVPALAALIGRPLAATGGVAARIARGNAIRLPERTAGTAAALMVGVALVAFVAIFVNGFKASFSGAFEAAVTADFVIIDPAGLTSRDGRARRCSTRRRRRRDEPTGGSGQAPVGGRRHPRGSRSAARAPGRQCRLGRGLRR
jgi:putative ABC transport system permease protein